MDCSSSATQRACKSSTKKKDKKRSRSNDDVVEELSMFADKLCEFGPDFEKCKPWLIHYAPHLYPDLLKEANAKEANQVSDQFQSTSISDATASSGGSTSKQEVKHLPGGKIKKKDKQVVI
ncbi:hypothetical protein LOK49_LG05G02194 [Camellia lanceoleosa]|uniref:Uncharacterized protein n=1 Tax=Camellia lanceoleosa TaxID=1840588 RepID=A0ACC0HSU2_9ERIC|nr:hypothetical protein LOK49_LG05G02194 [Camellia lanceoleosa]